MAQSSSVTTRLTYQHKTLFELVEKLSDSEIRKQVIPGKWSVFENIVHLATYQHTFLHRIEEILNKENPSFQRYTAETDPLFIDALTKPTREITKDFVSTRRNITAMINGLKDEHLNRTGVHPAYGVLTLIKWTEFFLLHEAHHLFTIFKLTCELRK